MGSREEGRKEGARLYKKRDKGDIQHVTVSVREYTLIDEEEAAIVEFFTS